MDTSKWIIRERRAIVADDTIGQRVGDTVYVVFDTETNRWLAKGLSPAGAIDRSIKMMLKEAKR